MAKAESRSMRTPTSKSVCSRRPRLRAKLRPIGGRWRGRLHARRRPKRERSRPRSSGAARR
eukprot:2500298-Prymnesium_polylepis.1